MRWIGWCLIGLIVYAFGFFSGSRWSNTATELTPEIATVPQAVAREVEPDSGLSAEFESAIADFDWTALVQMMEEASYAQEHDAYARMYQRMLELGPELAAQEAASAGVELLSSFVELNPYDETALFLLSDLHQAAEDYAGALDPIFQVLDTARTVEIGDQAKARRDELIALQLEVLSQNAIDSADNGPTGAEASSEDAPEQAIVAFQKGLVQREPTNDQHRLALAQTLLETEQFDAAGDVLDAIAGFGVSPAEVQEARQQVQLGAAGMPIQRHNNALYAQVLVNGQALRLLVDTGASKTVIQPGVLRALNATPQDRVARLLTAGGPVRADVYEVSTLQFGALELSNFEVVALDAVPRSTDGLLGMDLLNQVAEIDFSPLP